MREGEIIGFLGCISRRFRGDRSELGADFTAPGGTNRRLRGNRPELTADSGFYPPSPPIPVFGLAIFLGVLVDGWGGGIPPV